MNGTSEVLLVLFLDLSGEYMSVIIVKIYGTLDFWYVQFNEDYTST